MLSRIRLFKLFGFTVWLDLSWFIIAFLLSWSLAKGFFPASTPGLSVETYWWMGWVGVMGLFLSIVIHEFSHSLVARKFGIPMGGITLFIFGGVAEMNEEPPNPKSEFWMAIVGPITSIVLGFLFYLTSSLEQQMGWPSSALGVLNYLGWINWFLAFFNMVPAFPLDGGRVLRSALWAWKKNIQWATRISSAIKALSIMNKTGNQCLVVVENSHLLGIITLKDMLRFLSLKLDLETKWFITFPNAQVH
jgi:Zn-dependent protease